LYPRKADPEDADDLHDLGSFFNWFTQEEDLIDVSNTSVVS
jgi:hypothetical protein